MKPSTAKAKGRETENLFVAYMQRVAGLVHLERRRLKGGKDEGDVTGWPGVVVEVKSGASLSIPQWLRELDVEIVNAHADPVPSFLVVRPKSKRDPAGWWVIRRLPNDIELLRAAGYLPALTKETAA